MRFAGSWGGSRTTWGSLTKICGGSYESEPLSGLIVNRYDTHPNAAAHALAAARTEGLLLGQGAPGRRFCPNGEGAGRPAVALCKYLTKRGLLAPAR